MESGLFDKAIPLYEKILNLRPVHAQTHNDLGKIYMKKKKIREAMFHFREALKSDQNFSSAYLNLANLRLRDGSEITWLFYS